jgi:hypothetical protein
VRSKKYTGTLMAIAITPSMMKRYLFYSQTWAHMQEMEGHKVPPRLQAIVTIQLIDSKCNEAAHSRSQSVGCMEDTDS